MFIFNKELKLTSVNNDFIKANSLPSLEALQNTSVIRMIALIVSPQTEADYSIIWETQVKLLALRPLEEFTCKLPIANQLYEVSFRTLSNNDRVGKLRRMEKAQMPSQKDEKVGGLLTLSGDPSALRTIDAAIAPKSKVLRSRKTAPTCSNVTPEALPRILVVDDSDVNREVVNIFLSPDFPKPIYARNGLEALNTLHHEQVDLILMDIHMPEMNGVEATLAIRQANAPWSNIIIIALTADTAYQHSRVYKNIGMDDAISKPIRHDVLIKTILSNWNGAKLTNDTHSTRLERAS